MVKLKVTESRSLITMPRLHQMKAEIDNSLRFPSNISVTLYLFEFICLVDGEKREEDVSSSKTPKGFFKRGGTNHSMFRSETGTGLRVSFIPNNLDQQDESILLKGDPSSSGDHKNKYLVQR